MALPQSMIRTPGRCARRQEGIHHLKNPRLQQYLSGGLGRAGRGVEFGGARPPARWRGRTRGAPGGEGVASENLRKEINDLRKQIAELAMERDVLTRSLARWAKGPTS